MKIVTVDEMRRIEQQCELIGLPAAVLMENAGQAVAVEVSRILLSHVANIAFLIGPGNNGGDGLVAACYLYDAGNRITVYIVSQRPEDSNLGLVKAREIKIVNAGQDEGLGYLDEMLAKADCVVDAVFGTGNTRPLQGIFSLVMNRVNTARQNHSFKLVAIDLPSGLNADTGSVDPACSAADYTITLGFPKKGLFVFPGAEKVGKLVIVDIGIPEHLAEGVKTDLLTDSWAKTALPHRPLNANKGSFGRVMVAAGSINYTGAAYLACSGAMRTGAGLVTMALAESLLPIIAPKLIETTFLPLPEARHGVISPQGARIIGQELNQYNVLLAGCGLGQSELVAEFLQALLALPELPSLVLDADALNILAKITGWPQKLPANTVLTPHPGEMARLCGLSIAEIQADRLHITNKMAMEWQKTVVLKGAFTVIGIPDGRAFVSPFANPGLAAAGTGDVLAGAIAGFAAQGVSLPEAAALGVYIHGKAGEALRDKIGDTGMLAGDLLPELPVIIKNIKTSV